VRRQTGAPCFSPRCPSISGLFQSRAGSAFGAVPRDDVGERIVARDDVQERVLTKTNATT